MENTEVRLENTEVRYLSKPKDNVVIELHNIKGKLEVYWVPKGGRPIATGVYLEEKTPNKFTIKCRIRNKDLVYKPEEVVRQKVLNWLIDELGYSHDVISVEVPVTMGSSVHDKPADIVVYNDTTKESSKIIIETKKPNRKDGIEQLKSYMNPTGTVFGLWTDGLEEKPLLRSGNNDFSKPINRIPRVDEDLNDIDEPLTKEMLVPVKDLYSVLKDIEQEVLAHQSVDTFNEIFKVIFAKLYDERVNLRTAKSRTTFRMGLIDTHTNVATKVKDLFENAKRKWRDVYGAGEEIILSDQNIAYCVQALQQYHLIRSGDILGTAFELLVNQEMKGDMGQFFTPRPVVDMMVKMMNPRISETVCDPSCGSGGFLIYSMRSVYDYIDKSWEEADDRAEQRKDYAQEHLIGIDNDNRLIKVCKAYMIMENDGRSGIFNADSLDYSSWRDNLKERVIGRAISKSESDINRLIKTNKRLPADGVDIILANPPFAGGIKTTKTLNQFELAFKTDKNNKKKMKNEVVRAILFIERCIDMLKEGGRMGIVLPQGIFNNITDQDIREFIGDKCRVLGVVGLHAYTFRPFTLAKTSVLFVQKWRSDEDILDDYSIFTAVSHKPGKDKLGRSIFKENGVELDTDMNEIAESFKVWAKNEGLDFYD